MPQEKQTSTNALVGTIIKILQRSHRHPIPLRKLQAEISREVASQKPATVASALEEIVRGGTALMFDDNREPSYFLAEHLDSLKARLSSVVRAHHAKFPFERGMKISEIKKRFSETETQNARRNIDPRLFDITLSACRRDGTVIETESGIQLPDFRPRSQDDAVMGEVEAKILGYLAERPFHCVNIENLSRFLGIEVRNTKAILAAMLRGVRLTEIGTSRLVDANLLARVRSDLEVVLRGGARLRLTEIAVLLGYSRTSLNPVMDYFDRIGVTFRDGDFRGLSERRGGEPSPDRARTLSNREAAPTVSAPPPVDAPLTRYRDIV
jgi:selenocysteine-specific elongation factor